MKKAWIYVGVFVVVFGFVLMLGKQGQREQARARAEARGTKTQAARPERKFPSWSETQEWTGETGPMTLIFESKIKLENLWDPFVVSGPVSRARYDLPGSAWELLDVTNDVERQPEWWDPFQCCGSQLGQIWRFRIRGPQGAHEENHADCWFWVCDDTDGHEGTMTVTYSGLERIDICTFKVQAESEYHLEFDGCMDEDGAGGSTDLTGLMIEHGYAVGDEITLTGTFLGCLHKGTAGKRYITHEMACNCYNIDLSDWEKYFWGGDAIGYGDGGRAHWEAVNNFAGAEDCAWGIWSCKTRAGGPDHAVDPAGRPWMAYEHEQNIRVVYRSSPQRQWHEVSPAFDEMGHSDPSILCFADGIIMVAARRLMGHTELKITPDGGKSWRRPGE